jgi:hypothetical protein
VLATGDDLRLAIDLYKDSNAALVSLWAYYASVAVPLLVFVLGFTTRIPGWVKIALAVIFAAFAVSNGYSMWRAQLTLQAAAQAIKEMQGPAGVGVTPALQPVLQTLTVFAPWVDVVMQAILSVGILVAIGVAHVKKTDVFLNSPART